MRFPRIYWLFKRRILGVLIRGYVYKMKTATLTYPKHLSRRIDLAPLDVRYRVLMASIMALIEAGKMTRVVKLTAKLNRLVRCYVKLHTHNEHLTLKLDMLLDKPWRERVLKELGGMSRLKLWEAAKARIEERRKAPPKPARKAEPSWLYTPERIAESERLKAYARKCGKATAHPRVFREPVRVDYDGLFRLAPLPRGERAPRQVVVYTANTISDYDWNNMLIATPKGFGPAPVWPAEFYAAAEAERAVRTEKDTHSFVIPALSGDLTIKNSPRGQVPAQGGDNKDKEDEGEKRIECKYRFVPSLHPRDVLSLKVAYDLLDSPLG